MVLGNNNSFPMKRIQYKGGYYSHHEYKALIRTDNWFMFETKPIVCLAECQWYTKVHRLDSPHKINKQHLSFHLVSILLYQFSSISTCLTRASRVKANSLQFHGTVSLTNDISKLLSLMVFFLFFSLLPVRYFSCDKPHLWSACFPQIPR